MIIFQRHANLKYKYGNRQFWCRGYYVDTAGKNAKKIAEYIRYYNTRRVQRNLGVLTQLEKYNRYLPG